MAFCVVLAEKGVGVAVVVLSALWLAKLIVPGLLTVLLVQLLVVLPTALLAELATAVLLAVAVEL